MVNLVTPPPTRVAVATATINGQVVEMFLTDEWGRYFESLNRQVVLVTGMAGLMGQSGAVGAALTSDSGDGGSVEFIPTPGPTGPAGPAGPVIFMLQEPEESDSFWPVKNT